MKPAQYRAMEIRHERDLMHHGIDGQKWGVKHGPPYPLDSSKSTGSRLKVKTKKYQDYSKKEQERIKKGAQKGSIVGGPIGAAIGMHLSKKHIEQEKAKENENKKSEQTWIEETRKTIPKKREDNMRRLAKNYLKGERSAWDDGSELKFLSERVIKEQDGSKSTETTFANNKAWITVETNYDANGKVTSRYYSLDD